jgi:hypothetical protein
MSAWGTGLYSGDVSADVQGLFAELVRLPYDAGRLIEIAAATFEASRPGDDSYSAFWLAAADQLYTYGLKHAPTFELANDLIRSGADLKVMRGLGMSEKDLTRRATVLGIPPPSGLCRIPNRATAKCWPSRSRLSSRKARLFFTLLLDTSQSTPTSHKRCSRVGLRTAGVRSSFSGTSGDWISSPSH